MSLLLFSAALELRIQAGYYKTTTTLLVLYSPYVFEIPWPSIDV